MEYNLHLDGTATKENIIQGACWRFTLLTDEMVRMEYDPDGIFEDRPSQVVWNRKFPAVEHHVVETEHHLTITTNCFQLDYNKQPFDPHGLSIFSGSGGRWFYGMKKSGNPPRETNLKGTTRTLDRADGAIPLEDGLLDRAGRTYFDDSTSLLLDPSGWVAPRREGTTDCYYLTYGHHYQETIRDFYKLSGAVPLLPRYALGTWWSRYWKYTEQSYTKLIERFEREHMPFSVIVLDMDWHRVDDVPKQYGRGWTGYSWNKNFFPDPERFLSWLHQHHYKVTLNLHPADGVMPFEDTYETMSKALGRDPSKKVPIAFDVTDKAFLQAYFTYLHHPLEKQGIDFWWVDWQQGEISSMEHLDPLWMLNHFHTLDSMRSGNRSMILSRYAGLGSHRYPIGFSGDSVVSWESLAFQPYFTATASNIGYTWWSHDIGGHMLGYKDNELEVRWMQFGLFSPIYRLHSSSNQFYGKEPWHYPDPYATIMRKILRLRYQFLPYIYTMNWRCHHNLVPFIIPMYYDYDTAGAYACRNQYLWGSSLMVCPITEPTKAETMRGEVNAWLPPGEWIDFFDGTVYHGGEKGRNLKLCRTIDRIPVLGKSGAIVPMDGESEGNDVGNPAELDLVLFAGKSGSFVLYEDDGVTMAYEEGKQAFTTITTEWSDKSEKVCITASGDLEQIPESRSYRILLRGVSKPEILSPSLSYDPESHTLICDLGKKLRGEAITVTLDHGGIYHKEDLTERMYTLLDSFQMPFMEKSAIMDLLGKGLPEGETLGSLLAEDYPEAVKDALCEVLAQ